MLIYIIAYLIVCLGLLSYILWDETEYNDVEVGGLIGMFIMCFFPLINLIVLREVLFPEGFFSFLAKFFSRIFEIRVFKARK